MDNGFPIGEKKFKLNKINAFKQFHIVRRVAPVLSSLLPALTDLQKSSKNDSQISEADKLEEFAKILSPIFTGLSKLSDAEADFVLYGLLASVEMQQAGGNWARVSTESMLMIQDLELPVLLQIAGRAFAFNLSGFFAALPRQG